MSDPKDTPMQFTLTPEGKRFLREMLAQMGKFVESGVPPLFGPTLDKTAIRFDLRASMRANILYVETRDASPGELCLTLTFIAPEQLRERMVAPPMQVEKTPEA